MIYDASFMGEHLTVKVHAVTDDGTCAGKPSITLEVSNGTFIQMTHKESLSFIKKCRDVIAADREDEE